MARISKDDKLIQDNPNLSAYELLQKGLSEKKYEELVSKENEPPKQQPKTAPQVTQSDKLIPEINTSARAMPKLSTYTPQGRGDQVIVRTPDGKAVPMHPTYANKLVRKNPNYTIVG